MLVFLPIQQQNCHSYVFTSSSGWLNDPYPFYGVTHTLNNSSGSVFRFAGHSAFTGCSSTYMYYGKCGQGPLCYHDNQYPYGAHTERWCPLP